MRANTSGPRLAANCLHLKMADTRVLVIRAEPGASETAARLKALGLTPVVSPALRLTARDEALPSLSGYSGLVFTSANGVRFFAEASDDRTLPVWCVGPSTASEAVRQGFSPVHQSSGDAHDLAHFIAHHWTQDTPKSLLHIANSAARGVVKAALSEQGFDLTFVPLYEARPAASLSADAVDAISSGAPVTCLVHSAKGAEALAGLAKSLDLSNTRFVAISAQAAAPLGNAGTGAISIASHPDEDHLLGLLQRVLEAG